MRTYAYEWQIANWLSVGAGVGLLLGGAYALRPDIALTFSTPHGGSIAVVAGWHGTAMAQVLVFVGGWLLTGAALPVGHSRMRRVIVALLLYALVGTLTWIIGPLRSIEALPTSVLWWPRDVIGSLWQRTGAGGGGGVGATRWVARRTYARD